MSNRDRALARYRENYTSKFASNLFDGFSRMSYYDRYRPNVSTIDLISEAGYGSNY
jgi:hypothetical protein